MKRKGRKFFVALFSFILIFSLNIATYAQVVDSVNNSEPLHYMGALTGPSKYAKEMEKYLLEEYTSNSVSTFESVSLPTLVDNSYLYPTPMQQTQSDCVGYALGYALMSGMQALTREWTVNTDAHKFSPSFVYNISNEGVDAGIFLADAIYYSIEYGICPITYYSADNLYNASVPNLAFEAASLYKPTSYTITRNLTQIKQYLAQGKGVIMGIYVYEEMYYHMSETNHIYDDISGELIGAHAICLVGYDDAKNAFKFINSWGADWCQDGYGWISYELVSGNWVNLVSPCHGYVLNFSETDDYVMGDANLDNELTAADSRLALRFSNGLETPTDRQFVLSDVDGDGTITAADSNNILSYVAGTLDTFPLYE